MTDVSRRGPAVRVGGAMLAVLGVAACSPTFDWREARPAGAGVVAMFPCRPAVETRPVALDGVRVPMTMAACEAGGAMFGLAAADVGDPARAAAALDALRAAQAGNLGAAPRSAGAASVAGAGAEAPPSAQRFLLDGRYPDGSPARQHLVYFAKGGRVYQAAVLGAQAPAEAVDTFFEGIRVLP